MKIYRLLILVTLLLFALPIVEYGQTCGVTGIDGLAEVDPGQPVVYTAQASGPVLTNRIFNWKVSIGTITSGSGTSSIVVDTAGLGGQELIVSLEVPGCSSPFTLTSRVKVPIACGMPFDEYGDIKFEDEKARLDNFAIHLLHFPNRSGYLLVYAGMETYQGEASYRLSRAKSYIADVRQVDKVRLVTVDCGYSSDLTTVLLVMPAGVTPPECWKSQIPLSQVKFTKRRPKVLSEKRSDR